jgi:hypothetical protein
LDVAGGLTSADKGLWSFTLGWLTGIFVMGAFAGGMAGRVAVAVGVCAGGTAVGAVGAVGTTDSSEVLINAANSSSIFFSLIKIL